uniref:NADH dehydrogenase subunit 4 n=1 Tax=Adiscus speciosus TaxID=2978449 RepID=UPI0021CCEBBD|nr:NADH dehydrogenase subunit 4 [Adiscus speciosus]UWV18192.1 NADH dehydrogenase subunit 4 [Adiscus speciosus]
MMKFLLGVMFLIFLCINNMYWLVSFFFFFFSLIFMFVNIEYYFGLISVILGCDLISFVMIILSFWICGLMMVASSKVYKYKNFSSLFMIVVLCLFVSLYITFSSMNLFIFYLFFEISLIPTLLLILGWGYQPERLEAGLYLLFYTLFFSLPMMIMIFNCYDSLKSLIYFKLDCQFNNLYSFICMNMVFLVKIPMFFIHLWLPKAHVEAPISGSMILAGVMLKLGGYGLMRFMKLFMGISMFSNMVIVLISLVGGFIVSLICLRQNDIKSLIAYSSVSHMSLVLSGVMTLSIWGFNGGLILMVGHGLCSSGLFCLANISYERFSSRSFYLNKGLINLLPSLSLWWFLFCACNMAAPPSLNLLGEICLFNSIVSYSSVSMLLLMLMSFFSAAYSLFLYSYSQHGVLLSSSFSFYSGNVREYILLLLHGLPLNVLILNGNFLFNL